MICPALDAIRLPLTSESWLLKGAAFIEPQRSTDCDELLTARWLARDVYLEAQTYRAPALLLYNPYPAASPLHHLYAEALAREGRDLYQLLFEQERSRRP